MEGATLRRAGRAVQARPTAPRLDVQRLQELLNLTRTVDEAVELHAAFVEQRQVKIRERRLLFVLDVASAAQPSGATAGHDNRQVRMIVDIRIAHPAAEQ